MDGMAGLLKQNKKRRVKRGGRKHKKTNENLIIFSNNVAGLKNKIKSLKSEIKNLNASVFTLQESHFRKKGKLKIDNYEIFEAIRKKQKGGTILGAHKSLKPILISEYSEDFELLVVEIRIRNKEIRIMTGYGPQESWLEEERTPFFIALEQEIIKAELHGKSMIIEMDSNSKLGPQIIPKDPHHQSVNGKLLSGIIDRHGLIVANGVVDKCVGVITRRRQTKDTLEESIIDHVLLSEDLKNELESIIVDEEGNNALVNITKTKDGVKKSISDHNPMITNLNLKWSRKVRAERVEMYNLKNKACQAQFKEVTSERGILTSVFNNGDDINTCTKNFLKTLDQCIRKSFNKIRITEKSNIEIEELFNIRRGLRNKTDVKSRHDLEEVEKKLADMCAKKNYETIQEEIGNIDCEEGGVNSGHLWKLKKKLSPKCRDPPTAMLDDMGNLLTAPHAIEALAVETYKKRLENRKIKDDLKDLQNEKEELCKLRLKLASQRKTPPSTMSQLETVLKYLKKNKCRDPFGYANEIFKLDVAGDDLKESTLILMNRIKLELIYPEVLEIYDISSIYKNKLARNSFDNYRGIFGVPILRSILDRLIYNDEYQTIDENLSDSNVGARKKRNIRDNIFVLNAINNSVVNGNEDAVDIQVYDIEKCFDALWVEECINDLYDAGLDNDKLVLLFLENQNAKIAVKTNGGLSNRVNIRNIIMQGTVWGSLMCTATMDKFGQHVYRNNALTYKYKGVVDTPSLGMVDDILCVQKCSSSSVRMNAAVNAFIESKKLTLSSKKCHRIHVQNKKSKTEVQCLDLKVHKEKMHDSTKEKYLGDLIDSSGTIRKTIEERKNKGYGIISEILAILEDIPLGRYKMEIGLLLRQAMLLNGILFNSESWHSVSETEYRMLETVDEHLLRALVKGHSKTPLEFLYLEAGVIPIRYIISSRRLIYHQMILQRDDNEITKKIYLAQKDDTTPGDFVELIEKDFKSINKEQDDLSITTTNRNLYKQHIKAKVKAAALDYLKEKQKQHSKIKHIQYNQLKTQKYMVSPVFSNEEVNLLYALRSRATACRANFKQKYIHTNILCTLCQVECDDQQHILQCKVILDEYKSDDLAITSATYDDIFSDDVLKQKEVTTLFLKLFSIRDKLIEEKTNPDDPSSTRLELDVSDNLLDCIVYSSPGK